MEFYSIAQYHKMCISLCSVYMVLLKYRYVYNYFILSDKYQFRSPNSLKIW